MSFRWLRAAPLLLSCVLGACSSDSTEPVVDAKGCADGKTRCGTACADLNKDPRYCGACGRSCDVGQVCSRGSCQLACQNGLTDCSGGCTNLKTDPGSCGGCETQCDSGMVCSAGTCAATCQAGLTLCTGLCIDTQGDLDNCGACGKPCAQGQLCSKGKCTRSCEQGLVDCNGQCRDLTADDANCGVCGAACTAGEKCVGSKCVVECGTGLTDCSGSCKDLAHDPAHCGGCATACPAVPNATPVCTDSTCSFVCKANFANCGSGSSQEGCNTDLSTDPFNCGACGHFCLGKSCVASQCEVETLVTGLMDTAMASNGQFLFYRGYESIMQLPLDGSSVPIVFAAGVPIAYQMAIHGNFLIWTEYNTGVWSAPILGGTPMPLATGTLWLSEAMTVGQGYVYWTNDSDSSIHRVSLAGGQPELIASGQDAVSAIDTDATHVYWTNQAGGLVAKAPLAGGTLEILSEQTAVSSIAVAGGWVYWTDSNLMQLTRIPIGGGTAEVVATDMKYCTGLVRDASSIYWSSEAGIWRLSVAGTGLLKLATSALANQRPMAVDGDYVYWFATDLGSILRVAK